MKLQQHTCIYWRFILRYYIFWQNTLTSITQVLQIYVHSLLLISIFYESIRLLPMQILPLQFQLLQYFFTEIIELHRPLHRTQLKL